jgi:hypothetical protein
MASVVGPKTLKAYQDGTLDPERRAALDKYLASGEMVMPEGVSMAPASAQPAPPATPEPGLMDRLGEMVTGSKRRTPETEAAPDWSQIPEWTDLGTLKNVAALAASPEEALQILTANSPGMKVRKDEKGNLFAFSPKAGKEFAVKPGLDFGDVVRAGAVLPLYAAGAASGGIATIMGREALLQGGVEVAQAASGGEFNPTDIAAAGLTAGAIPVAQAAGQAVRRGVSRAANIALDAIPGSTTRQAAEAAAAPVVADVAAPVVAKGAPIDDVKLADLARRASEGNTAATRQLAEAVAVDPAAVESAKRLGIDLPADVFSESEQIRSALGGVRGKIGSEAEAAWQRTVKEASDKADEVVQAFDGAPSPGAVSDKVLARLQASRDALKTEAKTLYNSVDEVIKPSAPVTLDNVDEVIRQSLKDLDGDVSALSEGERMMMRLAERGRVNPDMPAQAGRATHEALKRVKADLQRAVRMGDGPFMSNDQRRLKILEQAIKADELANAERLGGAVIRDKVRLAHQMTAKQKGLEDRMIGAFGRDKEGSVAALMQGAIADASKGNSARLTKLLKAVPQDLHGEVLMTALSSATRAKQGVAEAGFGFSEFAKTYAGLRAKGNEPIFAQLSKSLGPERSAALRDLFEISKRITSARANVKQTGKANQPFMQALEAESFVQRIAGSAMGKAAAVGIGGAGGGGLGAVGANALFTLIAKGDKDVVAKVGKMLISPEFSALAIERATNPTVKKETVRRVVNSQRWRDFAKAANVPREPKAAEKWLTAALQAARQTKGEQ